MSFLVDTDIVSAHLRGHRKVTAKFLQFSGRLSVSTVTLAELKTWLYRSSTPTRLRESFSVLSAELVSLPINESVAETFGRIGAALNDLGRRSPTPDLLIAATAVVHDLTLITGNTRHFAAIPNLRVDSWLDE